MDTATNKERFDLAIGMLKAYYDAVEQRTFAYVGFFVIVCGWAMTSNEARKALKDVRWLWQFGIVYLSVVFATFVTNICWWLHRWRDIYKTVVQLQYVEPKFYTRYELRRWTPLSYIVPLATLYFTTLVLLWACRTSAR